MKREGKREEQKQMVKEEERDGEREAGSSEHNHLTCRNKLRNATPDPNTRMERLSSLYHENILAKQ